MPAEERTESRSSGAKRLSLTFAARQGGGKKNKIEKESEGKEREESKMEEWQKNEGSDNESEEEMDQGKKNEKSRRVSSMIREYFGEWLGDRRS